MGPTPRVASFTSEKLPNGFRNTLLLTDVRNRASIPFREVGLEPAPLQGIRASPSGRYLLLLLRGAPSEIWAVRPPSLLPSAPNASPYANHVQGTCIVMCEVGAT
jgi:hypothetical protein